MPTAEPRTTGPGAGAHVAPAPGPAVVSAVLPEQADVVVVGAGCVGLATALRIGSTEPGRSVVVLEARRGADPRSWCSWDDGSDPLPEARSASWTRWEVRTDRGTSCGSDPEHPYVLVRAGDRRAAVEQRLGATAAAVRIVEGAAVSGVTRADDDLVVRSTAGPLRAETVLDARGPRCPERVRPGRVLLHQRFVGRWVTSSRPVFDPTTVTLMDSTGRVDSDRVHFLYVLPVSPTRALVESTVFTADAADPVDHRAVIAAYVRERWGLSDDEWWIDDEEQGCIPMSDAPATDLVADPDQPGAHVLGTTRPSSGYGFARGNRHAAVVARHVLAGTPVPPLADRARTRFLDAVFLRFLRDRPDRAPEVFRRMFALPGPLVVRFLTERSTLVDDVRLVLALPKRPFLAALASTVTDWLVRLGDRTRGRS